MGRTKKPEVEKVEEEAELAAPVEAVVEDAADALDKEIEAATKAPEGVKTAKPGVATSLKVTTKDGVKTIAPTGRFESIDNLIFNEVGQHVGTEENENIAAKKAGSFNTQRKFR